MARDPDPTLARRTARDARAWQQAKQLRDAWDHYVSAGGALAAIRQCDAVWPPSLADVAPAPCQLLAGHDHEHRHRIAGSQVTVTW